VPGAGENRALFSVLVALSCAQFGSRLREVASLGSLLGSLAILPREDFHGAGLTTTVEGMALSEWLTGGGRLSDGFVVYLASHGADY
jgi:hypothetical protein